MLGESQSQFYREYTWYHTFLSTFHPKSPLFLLLMIKDLTINTLTVLKPHKAQKDEIYGKFHLNKSRLYLLELLSTQ